MASTNSVTAFQAEIDTRRNLTDGNEDLIKKAQVIGDQKSQVHVGVEVATETVLFSSQISEEISKREELLKKYNVGGSRDSDRSSGGAACLLKKYPVWSHDIRDGDPRNAGRGSFRVAVSRRDKGQKY